MSDHWTEADVIAHCKRHGLPLPPGITDNSTRLQTKASEKPNKYRNIKTDVDGEVLDSRREARRWKELNLLGKAGKIAGVARQATFFLPGGVRYKADFVVIHLDGTHTVEDAKGVRTQAYSIKKRLMRALGIEIIEI